MLSKLICVDMEVSEVDCEECCACMLNKLSVDQIKLILEYGHLQRDDAYSAGYTKGFTCAMEANN